MNLAQYTRALIDTLRKAHPVAFARMREIVGTRKARIILDEDRVDAWFERGQFLVRSASQRRKVHGTGRTDSITVLDLLNSYIEVNAAILKGRLEVHGKADDVSRIFVAIDILLDVSSRTPALQTLARRFEAERESRTTRWSSPTNGSGGLFSDRAAQNQLLARLDLLA